MRFLFILISILQILISQSNDTKIIEHFPLFSKLIETDAINLASDKGYSIALVVYKNDKSSLENANNMLMLLKSEIEKLKKLTNINFDLKIIQFNNKGQFYIETDNSKTKIIYICEQFDEDDLEKLLFVSRELGIITFSAVNDFLDEGVSATVETVDGVPQLIIKKAHLSMERPNYNFDFSNFAKIQGPF